MSKHKKKRRYRKQKKSPAKIICISVIAVVLLAAFVLFAMPQILYQLRGEADVQPQPEITESSSVSESQADPEVSQTQEESSEEEVSEEQSESVSENKPAFEFPISSEDGGLVVENLFQFSGINPDCENREGNNTAAITIINPTDRYMKQADVSLLLQDGTELHFVVTELPAGRSAMAFSVDNTEIEADVKCVDVSCEAVFEEPDQTVTEKVSATVEGTLVTLVNTSGEDLSNVVVYCRCLFDEDYFGGVTYQYTINDLPAGGSATVDAVDCLFGEAEVVRIAVN